MADNVNSVMRRDIPQMRFRELGRTGLEVSILSLGSGGPNKFGRKKYVPRQHIIDLVHLAIDMGINFFDTAPVYGESEVLLGEALKGVQRDRFIVATKFSPITEGRISSPKTVIEMIERSLKRLRIDIVDLLQFHVVTPDIYHSVTESLMPVLDNLRKEGKFRYLGITESTSRDREHKMLGMALEDDIFDTIMVAYGPSNRTAEDNILRTAGEKGIGVIGMAPLREIARSLRASGGFVSGLTGQSDKLLQLRHTGDAGYSVTDPSYLSNPAFAYRYSVSHPAVSTVLTGTTDTGHLVDNALAVLCPH